MVAMILNLIHSFSQDRFLHCSVALHRNPHVILIYVSVTLSQLNGFKDGTLKTAFLSSA